MKKILHLILACFYKEGFGYQENILPAKHVQLGYDTYILTNHKTPGYENPKYINRDGVHVTILEDNNSLCARIPLLSLMCRRTKGLYEKIEETAPDIIFIHGLQSIDNLDVYKYKKNNPNVEVYVDQHGDYYNMPVKSFKDKIIQKVHYKRIAKRLERISEKMWGVTPWRVDYLQKVYGISPSKTGLLVMGGDEKLIDWNNRANIRKTIREKHNIPDDAFLIITGGKIDKAKNIHILMEAFNALNKDNTRLFVFGNYTNEMEELCRTLLNDKIINLGWLDSKDVYPLFLASDLAVFPGTHSVLWEQVCAAGLPAIFKDWNGGMSHVDVGGNCILMKDISTVSLKDTLLHIINDKQVFVKMRDIAENEARKTFSYIEIAKKAIGIN